MVRVNETHKKTEEIWTYEKVYDELKAILVDALSIEESQVMPEASLIDDLGAESIDFVDIAFRVEQVFGIKLPLSELAKHQNQDRDEGDGEAKTARKFLVQSLAEYIYNACAVKEARD